MYPEGIDTDSSGRAADTPRTCIYPNEIGNGEDTILVTLLGIFSIEQPRPRLAIVCNPWCAEKAPDLRIPAANIIQTLQSQQSHGGFPIPSIMSMNGGHVLKLACVWGQWHIVPLGMLDSL